MIFKKGLHMRIINDIKLDFKDVLIVPKRSASISRKDVNLIRSFSFNKKTDIQRTAIPIIAANMDTTGTFEIAIALEELFCMTALHKHYNVDELTNFFDISVLHYRIFYSLGVTDDDIDKLKTVLSKLSNKNKIKNVCIDVANGYTDYFVDRVKIIKDLLHPSTFLMAGNVCTPEMTEQLVLNGVSVVKVGIGGGSVCLSRIKTGCGYPQLSAVIECADAAHGLGGYLCSDGGCTRPGDVAKAFGAGADFVMLGGMLAGHDECNGEIVEDAYGNKTKEFYGMSSKTAQEKHNGGVADYKSAEGKTVKVPYRGKVEDTMKDILGGLRSACTYVGAKQLKHLSKCTTFIRTTVQENQVFN